MFRFGLRFSHVQRDPRASASARAGTPAAGTPTPTTGTTTTHLLELREQRQRHLLPGREVRQRGLLFRVLLRGEPRSKQLHL